MTEATHAGLRLMIHATRRFREALPFFDDATLRVAGEVVARWTTKHDVTLLGSGGQPMAPRRLHLFENPWSYDSYRSFPPIDRTYHPSLVRACTWDYDPVVFRACDWEPVPPYRELHRITAQHQAPTIITGFYGLTQQHAQIQLQRQVTCPDCLVLFDALMSSKS